MATHLVGFNVLQMNASIHFPLKSVCTVEVTLALDVDKFPEIASALQEHYFYRKAHQELAKEEKSNSPEA